MARKYEQMLTFYFLIAGILFLCLFTPVNGYDSPPKKVLKGDTLYEYVSDKFNNNPYLTRLAFEKFPEPYTYAVDCYDSPIDNCSRRAPIIPEKNILLANTSENSSDGDMIETKGKEIIIIKPSGRVDRLPLVSDGQLEVKKYTQVVQNIVLAGSLFMIGIVVFVLFSDKKRQDSRRPSTIGRALALWSQKIFDRILPMYIVLSVIAAIIALLGALPLSTASIFRFIYIHILLVAIPMLLLTTFILMPIHSIDKQPSILKAILYSFSAGVFGVAAFYVAQVIIMNGWR